ncbi:MULTISPECIES: DUF3768 domain-containing protein [Alphaproteobacteria]|uniref:DUF3768 domain-containing protein n=2 Tax=Alphaproteobacteria TaxID=28211 RepID=A0A512HQ05_9HYPH|nr:MULTISPECIES: DUF3768 domain-containing protein [Alphaproteobacteria]GEO87535.1 hypothetical protein RNA01_44670 [Ciceribacter naphthalenivorans]GLR22615.1 hypothetical protein GCM10007920_24020 [Ciceribacter naphthalenivorans]GLT05471.1 hypothetical protein GCM10007926_24020 [Sphingomonas psychrolutea]
MAKQRPTAATVAERGRLTPTEQIRRLNDWLRMHGSGGRIVMTAGIAALDDRMRAKVVASVRSFNAFDDDNDPHGEHDCARIEVEDLSVLFKIDYYDLSLSHHSADPSDPDVTCRVLTLMLAEEY